MIIYGFDISSNKDKVCMITMEKLGNYKAPAPQDVKFKVIGSKL